MGVQHVEKPVRRMDSGVELVPDYRQNESRFESRLERDL